MKVFVDRRGGLRVAEAEDRELQISVGCALDNLLNAAEHFERLFLRATTLAVQLQPINQILHGPDVRAIRVNVTFRVGISAANIPHGIRRAGGAHARRPLEEVGR